MIWVCYLKPELDLLARDQRAAAGTLDNRMVNRHLMWCRVRFNLSETLILLEGLDVPSKYRLGHGNHRTVDTHGGSPV